MSRQGTGTDSPERPLRWSFMVAGTAAAIVTASRVLHGGSTALPALVSGLERPELAAAAYVHWHALSVTFAALAVALLAATRLPTAAAKAIATIAATVFGATCILFMYYTHQATGSPFTYFPWLPLALTALLSGFAASRA